MNVTWNLQVERGASNPTFNSKMIFRAMARIQRYWHVNFVQVGSNPYMRFLVTNQQPNPTWAAWTSGRTIHIGRFRFFSDAQLEFVLTHEIGHVFWPGNRHANSALNVMYPSVTDVYKNFHLEDLQWYRLARKAQPNFLNEPNQWRPARTMQWMESFKGFEPNEILSVLGDDVDPLISGVQPCEVGHGSWSDWLRGFWRFPVVEVADE
jgi:hypothetical protein